MADGRTVGRGLRLSLLVVTALLLAGAHSPSFGSGLEPAPSESPAGAAPPPVPDVGALTTTRVGSSHAALPLPRACFGSISRMAACLSTATYAACGTSFSKFLGCSSKVYNAYDTTTKIQQFRTSSVCPSTLAGLIDYLCSPRVPPAPRSVLVTVDNNGYALETFTGPSRHYTFRGTYPAGTRLAVVCVARFGQIIYFNGSSSAYWSRLTNGLFVPWIALEPLTSDTVPWC